MKNSKKILVLAIALFTALGVFAQDSPFRFGVKAGINYTSPAIDRKRVDTDSKFGFQIGATVDYSLTDDWYILSGLTYASRKSEFIMDRASYGSLWYGDDYDLRPTKRTLSQHYLQLPIHIGYRLVVGDVALMIDFGPYFEYGIGGKTKQKQEYGIDNKVGTFSKKEYEYALKRFDFGLGAGISGEYQKFVLGVEYNLGLLDISAYDDGPGNRMRYRDRNLAFTLGYKL